MADSPRKVYLSALADCLRRIRKADGYATDAGEMVTLEPAPKLADNAPFITPVWSRQARATDPAVLRTTRATTVDIIAKVPAVYTRAQEALDEIVADIERALEDQRFRFPVGYQFPQYQSAEPIAAAAADGWVGVVVTVAGHIPIQPR